MTTDIPPATARAALQTVRDQGVRAADNGLVATALEALDRAGWLHDPDVIVADRDAARAEIGHLTGLLRDERRSHAETWARAGESGEQLIEARAENARLAAENARLIENLTAARTATEKGWCGNVGPIGKEGEALFICTRPPHGRATRRSPHENAGGVRWWPNRAEVNA